MQIFNVRPLIYLLLLPFFLYFCYPNQSRLRSIVQSYRTFNFSLFYVISYAKYIDKNHKIIHFFFCSGRSYTFIYIYIWLVVWDLRYVGRKNEYTPLRATKITSSLIWNLPSCHCHLLFIYQNWKKKYIKWQFGVHIIWILSPSPANK